MRWCGHCGQKCWTADSLRRHIAFAHSSRERDRDSTVGQLQERAWGSAPLVVPLNLTGQDYDPAPSAPDPTSDFHGGNGGTFGGAGAGGSWSDSSTTPDSSSSSDTGSSSYDSGSSYDGGSSSSYDSGSSSSDSSSSGGGW
jgi:hypothetical protein